MTQVSTISIGHFRTNNNIIMHSTAINHQFSKIDFTYFVALMSRKLDSVANGVLLFQEAFFKKTLSCNAAFFLGSQKGHCFVIRLFSENSCGCIVFFLFVPFAFTFVALGEKFELDIAQNSRPRPKK